MPLPERLQDTTSIDSGSAPPATCETCRFSSPSGTGDLLCRRHAPVAFVEGRHTGHPVHPNVGYRHWCGDYERRQEQA